MKTTTSGRSGLRVSRIAFGTWQLGGEWGPFDEDTTIRHAREQGVNFFDTAQAYGFDKIMDSAVPVAGPSPETV
ncbi:aldo/keto reductase [Nocardia sp. CA-107356]|uniref:aldo/keto reductase n=1 Tax=Nocardia sp. CA-107356 TaxID=3239972 RepID=UPI003D93554A